MNEKTSTSGWLPWLEVAIMGSENCRYLTNYVGMPRLRFLVPLLLSLGTITACTEKSPQASKIKVEVISGDQQSTPGGTLFPEPIKLKAIDPAANGPVPNARIIIEAVEATEESGSIILKPILTTGPDGTTETRAVGGNKISYDTKFRAYIMNNPDSEAVFTLRTTDAGGAGTGGGGGSAGQTKNEASNGKDTGNASGENDGEESGEQMGGGGGTNGQSTTGNDSGNDKGDEVGSTNGGGGGATDPNVAKYTVVTEHAGVENAGVGFNVVITALNKDDLVVTTHDSDFPLTINLLQKNNPEGAGTILSDGDFAPFPPSKPSRPTYRFIKGVLTLTGADQITIRKTVANMVIQVLDEKGVSGESSLLKIIPGPLDRLAIVAVEDVPGFYNAGQEIAGPTPDLQGGLRILSNPADPALKAVSSGTSITMRVDGYDQFTNLYDYPIPTKWSAFDVGYSVATFPDSPISSKYLALRVGLQTMNLFVPNQEELAFLSVEYSETVNGITRILNDDTGIFKVVEDKPTTLLVDFWEPTSLDVGEASAPGMFANPLTDITAGNPVWLRLSAADSFGQVRADWEGEHEITFTIVNSTSANGWPIPVDATVDNPTANTAVPNFMGQDLFFESAPSTLVNRTFTFPAMFEDGHAWVRITDGGTQTLDMDDRPFARLSLFDAEEQPIIQLADLANNLNGQLKLSGIKPNKLSHIRMVFNDLYQVPPSLVGDYPTGIDVGTTMRGFEMRVGDGISIQTIGYDEYGNSRGPTPANWQGSGSLPDFFLAFGLNTKVNLLAPTDIFNTVGGKIKAMAVAVDGDPDYSPPIVAHSGDIKVNPGIPAKFIVEADTTVMAGERFGLLIKAVDKAGNTVLDYDTQAPNELGQDVSVASIFTLAGVSRPVLNSQWLGGASQLASYNDQIAAYKTGVLRNLEFVNGIATIANNDPELAPIFFFSNESPVITVQTADQRISGGSGAIVVMPQPMEVVRAYHLKNLSTMDGSNPVEYLAGSVVSDVILQAGLFLKMEARGFDRYDNALGPVNVDWQNATDDDLGPTPAIAINYNGSNNNFAMLDETAQTIYGPRGSGKAYVKFSTSTGVCNLAFPCIPAAGPVVGFTGIVDSRIGAPVFSRVNPSNPLNPSIVAGDSFAMQVELLDANRELATTFSGTIAVTDVQVISLPGEAMSVGGYSPVVPMVSSLTFVNGIASLPGFKIYNIYDQPRVRVAAMRPDNTPLDNTGGDSPSISILGAADHQVKIIDAPQVNGINNAGIKHRPHIYDSANAPLTVYTSTTMEIFAGAFDTYGNWKQDVAVQWDVPATCPKIAGGTYANNFVGFINPAGAGSNANKTTLSAGAAVTTVSTTACLQITKTGTPLAVNTASLTDIVVVEGTPQKIKLTVVDANGKKTIQDFAGAPFVESGFQLKADEDFQISLSVHDAGGTLSAGVNSPAQPYTIELIGATASDTCPTHATPTQVTWTRGGTTTTVTGVEINNTFATASGVAPASSFGTFKAPKAGVPFTIRVRGTYAGITLDPGQIAGLTVVPNALERVNMRTAANGGGTLIQEQSTTITADTPITLVAAGYDRVCNYIGDQTSTWVASGQLSGRLLGNLAAASSVNASPKLVGSSVITAVANSLTDPDPCTSCAKTTIAITPGVATEIQLASENSGKERVGVPFSFSATVRDQNGNTVTGFNGNKELTFAWNAAAAPAPAPGFLGPKLPTLTADRTYSFTAGVLDAGNFATVAKRLSVGKAGQVVALSINHTDGALAIGGSITFDALTGPVEKIQTFDLTGPAPVALTTTPGSPLLIIADKFPAFGAKGFDIGGNDLGLLSNDYGTTGSLSPIADHLDRSSGLITIVNNPNVLGVGTLTTTYHRVGDPHAANQDFTDTAHIEVVPGSPVQFDIIAPGSVVANSLFGVMIVAKDVRGNQVLSFPNGKTFSFHFSGATLSPSSASFSGAVDSIPPTSGAITTRVLNSFIAPSPWLADTGAEFKLTNAKDLAVLHVAWTDSQGIQRVGASQPIDVIPAAVNFYRITTNEDGSLDDMPSATVTVGEPIRYYANGFDSVGNFAGNQAVLWRGTSSFQELITGPGLTDLVATGLNKIPTKVRPTLSGLPSEAVTASPLVEIRNPSIPTTVLDSVAVTLVPGPAAQVVAYLTNGAGEVAVNMGQITLPQGASAGVPSRYRVEVQDSLGNRANFDGDLNIAIDLPNAPGDASRLGFLPSAVAPGSATFVDGLWLGDASKTITYTKTGSYTLTARDLTAPGLAAKTVPVGVSTTSNIAHVRIVSGTTDLAPIYAPSSIDIDIFANSAKTFDAAGYDAGGNWISTVATALWTGSGSLAAPIVPASTVGPSLTVVPLQAVQDNTLAIEFDHDSNASTAALSWTLDNIDIVANSNYSEFEITAPTTTTADSCFQITIAAKDDAGNIATSYAGNKFLDFDYTNAATPHYIGFADPNGYLQDGSYTFTDGVSAPLTLCLRTATAGAIIKVTDPVTGATPIQGLKTVAITTGTPSRLEFSLGARDGIGEPEAPPTCEITTDADQVNQAIYVSQHDQWGNIIAAPDTTSWNWAAGGVLAASGVATVASATEMRISPTTASMLTAASELNVGTLMINGAGTMNICNAGAGNQPLKIHVNPGVATSYEVVVNDGLPVVATAGFEIKATARDSDNNIAWGIDSAPVSLTYSWVGTPLSSPALPIIAAPAIQSPVLLTSPHSANFVDGIYTTTATNRLGNSAQANLKVNVASANVAGQSPFISIVAGPAARVLLTNNPVTGDPVVPNNKHTPYLNSEMLYAAAYDNLGNFVGGGTNVSWSVTGYDLINNAVTANLVELSGTDPALRELKTMTINDRRITGGRGQVTINHPGFGAGPLSYTLNVYFDPDPATELVLTKILDETDIEIADLFTTPAPQIEAGKAFYLVVEARDASDNLEVTFPANFSVIVNSVAPAKTDLTADPNVNHSATLPASGSYSFSYQGRGRAKIGPFVFVSAATSHSIAIQDNDSARTLTTGTLPLISVTGSDPHHLTFLTGQTIPVPPAEVLITPMTITSDVNAKLIFTGSFDQFGNYLGNVSANFSWAWTACPSCVIGLAGNGTTTAAITPGSAGEGKLSATAIDPSLNNMAVESPLITVEAGQLNNFAIEPLFNDQNPSTPNEEGLTITDLANLSAARVFTSESDPILRFQRVGLPFSLRIQAKDANGNTAIGYCQGDQDPVNTPRICAFEVGYPNAPTAGPNGQIPTPSSLAVLRVRWNNGFGTFVDAIDDNLLVRPFLMKRDNQSITISLKENGGIVAGITPVIPIKTGPLTQLRMRNLANDASGAGLAYPNPFNNIEETMTLDVYAAGYDIGDNYAGDFAVDWTASNGLIQLAPNPSTNVAHITMTGVTAGATTLSATAAANADHAMVTASTTINVQPAPARSYRVTLVDGADAPVLVDADGDSNVDDVAVKAGENFRLKIEAMSGIGGSGSVTTSYDGSKKLILTADGQTQSALGMDWISPTPDTAPDRFNFTAGVGYLDSIQLMNKPTANGGAISLVINNENASIGGSIAIRVLQGEPGFVRIGRSAVAGDPGFSSGEVIAAGASTAIFSHLYDRGGNSLGVQNADWEYHAQVPPALAPALAIGLEDPMDSIVKSIVINRSTLNFIPRDASVPNSASVKATVRATVDGVANTQIVGTSDTITISGNIPSYFTLEAENGITARSTSDCFKMKIIAKDTVGNLSAGYNGTKNITWTMTLDDDTTAYPTEIAGGNPAIKSVVAPSSGPHVFGGGTYETSGGAFCLRDGTGLGPDKKVRITAIDSGETPAITGSIDIIVSNGPAARYAVAESQTEAALVCEVQRLVAGSVRSLWLHELDAVGNFLRQVPATWSAIGALAEAGVIDTATPVNGGVGLTLNRVGYGAIKYNFPGTVGMPATLPQAEVPYCNPVFDIINSPAKFLTITNANGQLGESAVSPFPVTVKILDEHGNVDLEFDEAINLSFTSTAQNAPNGTAPMTAGAAASTTATVSAAFTNGVWESSTVAKLFQAPKAYTPINISVSSDVAGGAFAGKVTAGGLTAGSVSNIPILPGPLAALEVRDAAGASGNAINTAWVANGANSMSTVGSRLFFAATADALGNFIANTSSVSWTLPSDVSATYPGPLPNLLDVQATNQGIAKYDAITVGDGVIRVSGTASLAGMTGDTATLTILPAPATSWRVTAVNLGDDTELLQPVAGVGFRLKVEAIDAENTVVADFDGAKNVEFTALGTSSAPAPYNMTHIPILGSFGQVSDENAHQIAINFVDGLGYLSGVILYNKDDTARFKVGGEGLNEALSGLLDVMPNNFAQLLVRYPQGFGHDPKTITATQPLPIEVISADAYGNNLGNVAADLSFNFSGISDFDGYTLAIDSADQFTGVLDPASLVPTANPPINTSVFVPEKSGHGKVTVLCTDLRCTTAGITTFTTAEITVNPGAVKAFVVEVEGTTEKIHHGSESYSPIWFQENLVRTASENFHIRVMAVDVHGNINRAFVNSDPLAFIWDLNGDGADDSATMVSANATVPQLPGSGSTWSFTDGVWRSAASADLAFKLRKAGQRPYLLVTNGSATISGKTSDRLDVLPASLAELRFLTEASNAGGVHVGNYAGSFAPAATYPNCDMQKSIKAGDSVRLYIGGFDADGNYRQDEVIKWGLATTAPVPAGGGTNDEALSSWNSGATAYDNSFFTFFNPQSIGDWKIYATSIDDTVTSMFCANVDSNMPSKFKAHVVYDEDNSGTLEVAETSLEANGPNGQFVKAGECFSLEVLALDANDNPTNYGGAGGQAVNIDFVSDAPLGKTGFQPIPYGPPLNMTVTFYNGRALTPTQASGRCLNKGSFVFHRASDVPTEKWFLRVSDGADTGLLDAELNIKVNKGDSDLIAMLRGNPADPATGVHVGTSRTLDIGQDMTNSANWSTDVMGCSSIDELQGLCRGAYSSSFDISAGATPGEGSARYYLGAFDAGGNYLGAATGDWSISRTTMGYSASTDSQWSRTPAPGLPWFEQYVQADGTYADRTGDNDDITNTSAVYVYPLKPKFGRLTVKNVIYDDGSGNPKKYVIAARSTMRVFPLPVDRAALSIANTPFLAGASGAVTAELLDIYNNHTYETGYPTTTATTSLHLYAATDTSFITPLEDFDRKRIPASGIQAMVDGPVGYGMKVWDASQLSVFDAGSYVLRISVAGEIGTAPLIVYPNIPVGVVVGPPTMTTKITNNCSVTLAVEAETELAAFGFDIYGNIVGPVSYPWVSGGNAQCNGHNTGFLATSMETITFKDSAGSPITPTKSGSWCYAPRVLVSPRKASDDSASGTAPTTTLTVNTPGSPLHGNTYSGLSSLTTAIPTYLPINSYCYQAGRVLPGPARHLDAMAWYDGMNMQSLGDPIKVVVAAKDKFGNDAYSLQTRTGDFSINWTAGTVADAPDMCGLRGLSGAACDAAKVQNGRNWQATAILPNVVRSIELLRSEPTKIYEAIGETASEFRIVNKNIDPELEVCYAGNGTGGAGLWAGLVGVCSRKRLVQSPPAPVTDIFVTSGPGGGYFYDILPTTDFASPSADKTFLTNETGAFYAGLFDAFGNYVSLSSSATRWTIADPQDAGGNAAPSIEFTNQLVGWDAINPVSFGMTNRLPRSAELIATDGLFSINIGRVKVTDSPPGATEIYLYADTTTPTPISLNGNVNAGVTTYATFQIRDINNNNYSFTSASAPVAFSPINIMGNRAGLTADVPASGNYKFCNGVMVNTAYNLANCPSSGAAPADPADWERLAFTVHSSQGSGQKFLATVDLGGGLSSSGTSRAIVIIPGSHDHYTVDRASGQPSFKTLDSSLRFIDNGTQFRIYASDVNGNDTTIGIPASETSVKVGIYDSIGTAIGGACPSGTALGSCTASSKLFRCGVDGGAVGNCLSQVIDAKSAIESNGYVRLTGLEFDTSGVYYLAAASTVGGGKKTFTNSTELTARAGRLDVRCGTDCVDHIDLTYNPAQMVGTEFPLVMTLKDANGRTVQDPTVNVVISAENIIWNAGLLSTYINGSSPDNRPAVGFNNTYSFSNGLATVNMTINKVNDPTAIPTNVFTFTTSVSNKTAVAPSPLTVSAGSAYEYRIKTVDLAHTADTNITVIDAAPSGLFNLKVESLDRGGNYINTPPTITLIPTKVSGAFASSGDFSLSGGGIPSCTLSSGVCYIDQIYYQVANTAKIHVKDQVMTNSTVIPQIAFNLVYDTIKSFDFTLPATISAYDGVSAGITGHSATITARDGAGNNFSGTTAMDGTLATKTVTTTVSKAGFASTACPVQTYSWTNGVTTCPLNIIKAGTLISTGAVPGSELYLTMDVRNFAASQTVVVNPNNLDYMKICDIASGCTTSISAETRAADAGDRTYYAVGYDAFNNVRGTETAAVWTMTGKTPVGMVNPGDYEYSAASGASVLKPKSVPSNPTNFTLEAALAPAVSKTVTTTITAGSLSKLVISQKTDVTNPLIAGNGNFQISEINLYYTVGGVDYLKTDENGSKTLTIGGDLTGAGASKTCNFVNGTCSDTLSFNLTAAQVNKTLSLTYGGRTATVTGITISPAAPASLVPQSVTVTAGSAFTYEVWVLDAFSNPTDTNCTGITVGGGSNTSPGGHGGTATAPAWGSVGTTPNLATGKYQIAGNLLYKSGTNTFTITACGLTKSDASLAVGTAAANATYLNTSNAETGTSVSEKYCPSSGAATSATVDCGTIYAFVYDSYGNMLSSPSSTCDSWSVPTLHSGTAITACAAATHQCAITAGGPVDSVLRCDKGGKTADILLYGGVSAFDITHNYGGAITAANDNIAISAMSVQYKKANVLTADANRGAETLSVATSGNNTIAIAGYGAGTHGVTFAAGTNSTAMNFDMTKTATNDSITVTLRGISKSITGIVVNPATANTLTVTGLSSTATANQTLTATATVTDAFGNNTNGSCGTLAVTGGQTSVATYSGVATAAVQPGAVAMSGTVGVYDLSGADAIKLYKAGSNTLTFSACSKTANATVTVSPNATVNAVVLNGSADSQTAISTTEKYCPSTGAAADANVNCGTIYAFAYDAYGNVFDSGASTCDSWAVPTKHSGTTVTTCGASTHSCAQANIAGPVDSVLRCTKGAASADILLFGGVADFAITHNYSGAKTAANDNVTISNMSVKYKKSNVATLDSNRGSETLSVATTGNNTLAVVGFAAGTHGVTFSGGNNATAMNFDMTKAAASDNITVTLRGLSQTISNIQIDPAAADALTITGLAATANAGDSLTATITAKDAFGNNTAAGCGNLTVSGASTSPGGHSGTATAPDYPAAFGQSSTGVYNVVGGAPIRIYAAGSNTLTFSACSKTVNGSVNVSPNGTVNAIWLNNSNSEPGSHQGSITCTEGTSVSCNLYAWAWDAYGNEFNNDAWSCPAWSYTDTNAYNGWTLSSASGHSTNLATSNMHIEGDLKCTVGGTIATTTVFGRITKNTSLACSNWACTGTTPTSSCTFTNNTGYGTASSAFTSSDAVHNSFAATCNGALATGNNCSTTLSGSAGFAAGTLTADPSESAPSDVLMNSSTASVQSGALAPNCSDTLATAITTAWECNAGAGRTVVTLTNNHAFTNATFTGSSTTLSPANDFVIAANSCEASGAASSGGTCAATLTNVTGGQTTSLTFNPSGGFFQPAARAIPASPSCSQAVTKNASVTAACSEANGTKTLSFTLQNNLNTLNTLTVGTITVGGTGTQSVVNNTCASVSPGNSCSFDVTYTITPSADDFSMSIDATDGYFNDITFSSGDISNGCP